MRSRRAITRGAVSAAIVAPEVDQSRRRPQYRAASDVAILADGHLLEVGADDRLLVDDGLAADHDVGDGFELRALGAQHLQTTELHVLGEHAWNLALVVHRGVEEGHARSRS